MIARRLLTASLAAMLVASAWSAGAASPAKRPTLKPQVIVKTDVITLGDLVEEAGAAAGRPVFQAPALGRVGTIQVSRIEEAALLAGLADLETAGMSQIVVSRAARTISRSDIETVLSEALRNRHQLDQPDLSLTYETEASFLVEAEAKAPLTITELSYDPKVRRVEATLSVADSRSSTLKPFRVSGQVLDMTEATILAADVARGATLRPSDIRIERRPRSDLPAAGMADPAEVAGRAARSALRAGTVLREQDLVRPALVERNSMVTVIYEAPGLSLSMRGKALAAGALGDSVPVVNPQSKRTVQGTVVGPSKVVVGQAAPGALAAIPAGGSAQ
jgi:flagellar basal body P-ring formation protein FlgA